MSEPRRNLAEECGHVGFKDLACPRCQVEFLLIRILAKWKRPDASL
jgi:hypothetical protein